MNLKNIICSFKKALSYAFTFLEGCSLWNAQQFGNVQKNPGSVENNELPLIFALYLPLYFDKNAPFLAPYFLRIAPFWNVAAMGTLWVLNSTHNKLIKYKYIHFKPRSDMEKAKNDF